MRLFCPLCGSLIPAEDMNLDKALAKCRKCDNLFGFAERQRRRAGRRGGTRLP